MINSIVKNNLKLSVLITTVFLFCLSIFNNFDLENLSKTNFFISFVLYFLLFLLVIDAYKKSKIVGVILFLSILLLPPNIFKEYKGTLFPITYMLFVSYFCFIVAVNIFNKWNLR